ncbi:MAG: CubicO group peptidase (beta-lactamase class C family) [Pseudohongiellaceae bacterium]|jgi:CubicO group peptidase (beta-lactamase class C family)
MYYIKLVAGTLLGFATWTVFVFVGAFYGWWMTPIAAPDDSAEFFRKATTIIEAQNLGNIAMVLIEDGKITGEFYSRLKEAVNENTVFSTASMSKWFTANAVMTLVEEDRISLDDPVERHLSRWQLPASQFDNSKVTIRRLLSHTAGLNDGLGFGDYESSERLPSLEESLTNPRAANGDKVDFAVQRPPGDGFTYSGGSYLILELLVEEVTGMTFAAYMQNTFFDPLGMTRSGYNFIGEIENNAGSYDRDGEPAVLYKYASNAATAFSTSTADLAKFVMAQLPENQTSAILSQPTIANMRQPHGRTFGADIWGLGTILYAPTDSGDFLFGHDGGNDPAINSTARINPDNSDAIIVLETGHLSLATNIGSQWVLWQTGVPDVLDSDSVIKSMLLPLSIGLFLILLASGYAGFRHSRHR